VLEDWYVTDPTANPAALSVGSAPVALIPSVILVPTTFGTAAVTGPPEETTKLIVDVNGAWAFAGGFCEMTKLSGTVVEGSLVTDTKKVVPLMLSAKTWLSPTRLGTVLLAIPKEYVTFTTEPPATTVPAAGLSDITYPNPTVGEISAVNVPGVRSAAMMST
jgi:hypothetical protein